MTWGKHPDLDNEAMDIVEQISALHLKFTEDAQPLIARLDEIAKTRGPLQDGYCDECGRQGGCNTWDCQAARSMIIYRIEDR